MATALAVVLAATAAATMPASGASAVSTISLTVPSVVTLDDSGCRGSGALGLGLLDVGAFSTSGPCTIRFGSTNDTSRLRIWQRDQRGQALERIGGPWTPLLGSTRWYSVAVSPSGHVWTGGVGGPGEPSRRLEHSTDGGVTWSTQTSCDGDVAYDLDALSDTLVYMASGGGICRTTTGGVGAGGWTSVLSQSGMRAVDMTSATRGWAVGTTGIYTTADGISWSLQYTDDHFTYASAISATAGGTIVASGRRSQLPDSDYGALVSTDYGATWTRHVLATSTGVDTSGVYGALAVSDTTLVVSTPRGRWRSTNAGATWAPVAGAPSFQGEPFVQDDGTILASSGGDVIGSSSDGGATWSSIPLGTGASEHNRQVAGNGTNVLWVAGYGDRRLRSTDTGATWTSMSQAKPAWRAVAAWDDQRWVVAGLYGAGIRTTDGGTTLDALTLGTAASLYDGIAIPGGTGVLVGGDVILRTTDHGATWQPVSSPVPGTWWYELDRDDDGTLWAGGSSGKLMRSTDDGVSWKEVASIPGGTTVTALAAWRGMVWVGSSGGQVWRSPDPTTVGWTAVPTGSSQKVAGIWAIDASTAVALTTYEPAAATSHTWRTADSGASWSSAPTSMNHVRGLSVDHSRSTAFVTGSNAYSMSRDGGLTWSGSSAVGVGQYIERIQPLGASRLIAAGDGSLVSRSSPASSYPDGISGAGAGFGACLETAPGASSVGWTLAGAGSCTATAPDGTWTPLAPTPASATAIIATAPAAAEVDVTLRFGARTAASQPVGDYVADLVVEAVAPGV